METRSVHWLCRSIDARHSRAAHAKSQHICSISTYACLCINRWNIFVNMEVVTADKSKKQSEFPCCERVYQFQVKRSMQMGSACYLIGKMNYISVQIGKTLHGAKRSLIWISIEQINLNEYVLQQCEPFNSKASTIRLMIGQHCWNIYVFLALCIPRGMPNGIVVNTVRYKWRPERDVKGIISAFVCRIQITPRSHVNSCAWAAAD